MKTVLTVLHKSQASVSRANIYLFIVYFCAGLRYFQHAQHSFLLYIKMCVSSRAPSRKRQATVTFTDYSRTVGPQHGT